MRLITSPAAQAMGTAGRGVTVSSVTQKDEEAGYKILSGFPLLHHLLTKAHPHTGGKSFSYLDPVSLAVAQEARRICSQGPGCP